MSIELEFGLENAAKVKPTIEELQLGEPKPTGLANPKTQRILFAGGLVLLALVVGLFLYFRNRESTDDAQVDGHITQISSKVYGRVAEGLAPHHATGKAGPGMGKL